MLLVAKPEGRRPLGRSRRRWVDNIRMDLVEVAWGDVAWFGLAQDRDRWRALVNSVLILWVP
jgi:predicted small integral membrane protein